MAKTLGEIDLMMERPMPEAPLVQHLRAHLKRLMAELEVSVEREERLQTALYAYADEKQWHVTDHYGVEFVEFVGGGNISAPWEFAQQALKQD